MPPGEDDRMKILTSYVFSTFAKILAIVMPVFIMLYLVVEFVERMDDFLQTQVSMNTILRYFLFQIPIVGVRVGPFAVLLSVALAVALLQRSREIIACLAAGTSPWQIIYPFLIGALVMTGMSLGTEEWLLPGAYRGLTDLEKDQHHSPSPGAFMQQGELWFRAPDAAFVHIELFDPVAERIHGIALYRMDPGGGLLERIQAREAVWLAGRWMLLDGTISHFQSHLAAQVDTFTQLERPIGLEPAGLQSISTPPAQMSLSDLRTYMRRLRDRGVDITAHAQDFQTKLATPLMAVVMAVVGLTAMWGHNTRRMSLGFISTLCGAAAYWLLVMAGTALSSSQLLSLPMGIWGPHVMVLSLSSMLFWWKTSG
jgi:lipopolysaccharide export system permease protein